MTKKTALLLGADGFIGGDSSSTGLWVRGIEIKLNPFGETVISEVHVDDGSK